MKNPGKIVILIMLCAGLLAALVAWRHQYHQGARVLAWWGSQVAYQIRMAPQCELWLLNPASSASDPELRIANQPIAIESRQDISQAPGLVHLRQALIHDASYAWNAAPSATGDWTKALVFTDPDAPDQRVILAIDTTNGQLCEVASGRCVSIRPIVDGLKTFLDDTLSNSSVSSAR